MRILFHDDFDGIASAAILGRYLQDMERWPLARAEFVPVHYGMKPTWPTTDLRTAFGPGPFAIVDFIFHPQADIYFDHHPTAFMSEHWRETYERRTGSPFYKWDPTIGSCARLIHEQLKPHWKWAGQMQRVADAGHMIDQAAYPSAEAYFAAEDPAILLNHALDTIPREQQSEVAYWMMREGVDGALGCVYNDAVAARTQKQDHLFRYPELMRVVDDNIVVTDLVGSGLKFLRYAPYYFHPQAQYTVSLYSAGENIGVSLGQNPWKERSTVNLGALAGLYGGGGHPYASGIQFEGGSGSGHANAVAAVADIVQRLRNPVQDMKLAA